MRLTLRTMLAYLDDILEPADAQELGNKIKESEFASGLVHRIRSCTQKLRLGAPKLEGKGLGLDANTVAEYLDNTLPQDRVPDFEKVCLESDVHLAEVASCHQILTLVLGEPADVSPALRDRIYGIPSQQGDDAEQGAGGASESSTAGGPQKGARGEEVGAGRASAASQPGEPAARGAKETAYVPAGELVGDDGDSTGRSAGRTSRLGGRAQVRRLALTLTVAFLVVFLSLMAMHTRDRAHPLAWIFGGGSPPRVASRPSGASAPKSRDARQSPPSPVVKQSAAASPKSGGRPAPAVPGPGAAERPEVLAEKGPRPARDDSSVATPVGATKPAEREQTPPSTRPSAEKAVEPVAPAKAPDSSAPADASAKANAASAPADVSAKAKAAPAPADASAKANAAPAPADVSAKAKAAPTDAAADLGRYISEEQILARFDAGLDAWRRLPPRAALSAGDRLLVLPTFRPQVVLGGIQLTFVGATGVHLPAAGDPERADIAIDSGRALLVAVGTAGAKIRLALGGRRGTAMLADAESSMAVEVRRYLPPGSDPEKETVQNVVRILATNGRIDWREGDGEAVAINAGQAREMVGQEPAATTAAGQFPDWVEPKSLSDIDRLGSEELEKTISLDRPLCLSLQEQVRHRRVELRTLAIRSLVGLGQYEPCLLALGDESYHSYWSALFDALHDAVSRGPDSAADVKTALERMRGEDGLLLYRMLWGYNPGQLKEGAAGQLVGYLDHEALDFRVLAFENLRRVTGFTLTYQPNYTEARRRTPVRRWRERLEKGGIAYKAPPTPLPQPGPSAEPAADTPVVDDGP